MNASPLEFCVSRSATDDKPLTPIDVLVLPITETTFTERPLCVLVVGLDGMEVQDVGSWPYHLPRVFFSTGEHFETSQNSLISPFNPMAGRECKIVRSMGIFRPSWIRWTLRISWYYSIRASSTLAKFFWPVLADPTVHIK